MSSVAFLGPQNRWRLWLRIRPHWGCLQLSPDPLAGFKRPTFKGRDEGEGAKMIMPPGARNSRAATGAVWVNLQAPICVSV